MNTVQVNLGIENLERVRAFFKRHLCATQRECAEALGLSVMAVNRHVRAIRSEWKQGQALNSRTAARR